MCKWKSLAMRDNDSAVVMLAATVQDETSYSENRIM